MFDALANWRWPNDEMGPGMYSWYHIIWLVICVGLSVFLGIIGTKPHNKKKDDLIIRIFAFILLGSEIIKQLMYHVGYYKYFRLDIFPFSFCSVPLYFSLVGSLVRNEKVKEVCYKFLAFFGIVGGSLFMLYPDSLNTYFIYISIQTMVWHTILVSMGVYLLAARGYGKNLIKDMVPPFIAFMGCVVLATIFNEIAYYTVLKPAETPTIAVDREYGTHTYYSYGYHDGDKYYYLIENDGTLRITEDFKNTNNFVLVGTSDIEGSPIQDDNFFITIDYAKYISLSKDGNGDVKLLVGENIPTSSWKFGVVGDDWTALCTEIEGINYYISFDKTTKEISPEAAYLFDSDKQMRTDFISMKYERDGDTANYFFISNHYKTAIPVLSWFWEYTPYPVFLLVYIVGFTGISCLVWVGDHFISPITHKRTEKENN